MGEMEVPAEAYYGASTQRAVLNFPISKLRIPGRMIRALGLIKWAAARSQRELGLLDADSWPTRSQRAALEVVPRVNWTTSSSSTCSRPAPAPRRT